MTLQDGKQKLKTGAQVWMSDFRTKYHLACWMCHCISEIGILEELKKEKAVWIPASSAKKKMSKQCSQLQTKLLNMVWLTLCIWYTPTAASILGTW